MASEHSVLLPKDWWLYKVKFPDGPLTVWVVAGNTSSALTAAIDEWNGNYDRPIKHTEIQRVESVRDIVVADDD